MVANIFERIVVKTRESIGRRLRAKRLSLFFEILGVTDKTRILDVGGTPHAWHEFPSLDVTIVNIYTDWPTQGRAVVNGNALALPFADRSFDIAFSNSVIEHLGTWQHQKRMVDGWTAASLWSFGLYRTVRRVQ